MLQHGCQYQGNLNVPRTCRHTGNSFFPCCCTAGYEKAADGTQATAINSVIQTKPYKTGTVTAWCSGW